MGGRSAGGDAGSEAGDIAVAVSAGGASDRGLCVEGGEGECGSNGRGGDCDDGGAALVSLFSVQSARTDVNGAAAARRGWTDQYCKCAMVFEGVEQEVVWLHRNSASFLRHLFLRQLNAGHQTLKI